MVVAPVAAGKEPALRALLAAMNSAPGIADPRNALVPFGAFEQLHFARLVVLDGLNQGAEASRAFRNGRTRFTFTMTVDARLQKSFAVGNRKITAIVDAYNVFNQFLQIEEIAVTGPQSRQTSAIQPPIVVQVGIRIPF